MVKTSFCTLWMFNKIPLRNAFYELLLKHAWSWLSSRDFELTFFSYKYGLDCLNVCFFRQTNCFFFTHKFYSAFLFKNINRSLIFLLFRISARKPFQQLFISCYVVVNWNTNINVKFCTEFDEKQRQQLAWIVKFIESPFQKI